MLTLATSVGVNAAPIPQSHIPVCSLSVSNPVEDPSGGLTYGSLGIDCAGDTIIETGVVGYLTINGIDKPQGVRWTKVCADDFCFRAYSAAWQSGLWHNWGKGWVKTADGITRWFPSSGYQRSALCV
jgi:hypothetical protein